MNELADLHLQATEPARAWPTFASWRLCPELVSAASAWPARGLGQGEVSLGGPWDASCPRSGVCPQAVCVHPCVWGRPAQEGAFGAHALGNLSLPKYSSQEPQLARELPGGGPVSRGRTEGGNLCG